jgi:hypothetical protein
MIILVFLWILFSVAEAYEDSNYVFIDHHPTVYPRIATGLLVFVTWFMPMVEHVGMPGWLTIGGFILILASVFWFVFEISRNLFAGQYFYYLGTTAKIDKWFKKYEYPVFWFRVWLIALAFCLYYYDSILSTI